MIQVFHKFVFPNLFNSHCLNPLGTFGVAAACLGTRPQAGRRSHNPPTVSKQDNKLSKFDARFEVNSEVKLIEGRPENPDAHLRAPHRV